MSFSVTEHLSISELCQVAEFYLALLSDSFFSRRPQSNFHRIIAANRCVLEAWGRDYIQCWTALPLTRTSMGKKYNMDSISVKLSFPLEQEERCSQLTEDQLQRAGERSDFGWLKCSSGIFYSSVLNTLITKGCRINEHYTWFSHPPCWTYLANLVLCYSCHHAEAFGLYIHKFYQKSFLLPADIIFVLYSSVLIWDRMWGWD